MRRLLPQRPIHWKTGCPCDATIRKVLVDDDKAATEIMTKYTDHIAEHEKYKFARGGNSRPSGRSVGRGGGRGGGRSTTKA